MAYIELLYKFYFDNEDTEKIKQKSYYFIRLESMNELNKKIIKEKIIEDGYNQNYFELITKFKYLLAKKEEDQLYDNKNEDDIIKNLSDMNDESIELEEKKGNYRCYLHLIISSEEQKDREKAEKIKEKNREEKNIKAQFSNLEQMSNELKDIKKQIYNLQHNIKVEQNAMIKSLKRNLYSKRLLSQNESKGGGTMVQKKIHNTMLINDKKLLYTSTNILNKKLTEQNEKKFYRLPSNEIRDNETKNNAQSEENKIFFLFSFNLKKNINEDYSYYKQFLSIYNIIKNQNDIAIDLKLKEIKPNLYLDQKPSILHIRVDSIKNDNQIYFKMNSEKGEYNEQSLKNLNFVNNKNLKLLIISSQNIDEIKASFDKYEINKIYIKHSEENEKNENENKFIEELYKNMIINHNSLSISIKNSLEHIIKNFPQIKKNEIFISDIKNGKVHFDKTDTKLQPDEESKNKLNIEMIKDNYCIYGRADELNRCLIKFQSDNKIKICVYGPKGVGKKSFVKKVGFSCLERDIFEKVFYLELNTLDNYNPEMKLKMLIDEISGYYTDKKILLIIYFNELITQINDFKDFIHRNEMQQKNNLKISYLYGFEIDDNYLKECQNYFTNSIELTHFKIYGKEEKKVGTFKTLFDYCIKEHKPTLEKNIIPELNKYYNDFYESLSPKKQNKKDELKNELVNQNSKGIDLDKINNKDINEPKNENKDNVIQMVKKDEGNIKDSLKGAKINNIFLFSSYINFSKDITKLKDVSYELFIKDNKDIKKEIISTILEDERLGKNIIKKIFLYLSILNTGIGKTLFKMLMNDGEEKIINFIKNELYGLIISEYYENEEIFKLDTSIKTLIEEIFKEKKIILEVNDQVNIMKKYFIIFRHTLKDYINDNGFHACIRNNFWFDKEAKEKLPIKVKECKFNSEIDTNNIYTIIKNIKKESYKNTEMKTYIYDISISLPTLLFFTNNIYFEYLLISVFEQLFEKIKKEENNLKINEIILRLGIFKYWVSKNPNFYENILKEADLSDKKNINLNTDAKFEYYLSKIFDCIIKKNRNIEEYSNECNNILEDEENENHNINKKRFEDLYKEAKEKIDQDPRNKFYFILENPLNKLKAEKADEVDLNSNFYLTQKLLLKISSDFGIEFKTIRNNNFDSLDKFIKKNNNIININLLYLSSKRIFDYWKNKKENFNIKILILGYRDDGQKNSLDIFEEKRISNIIYIPKNDIKDNKVKGYFEHCFIQFVHDFIDFITSKYDFCPIKEAFKKAKRSFDINFNRLLDIRELNKKDNSKNKAEKSLSTENLIEIKCNVEDDIFEVESVNIKEKLDNQQKIINDIYDEYEYEYNKIKNVYYRKNPFSEGCETEMKKGKYKKYMRLPGIDDLSRKNFGCFVEKQFYSAKKDIEKLEEIITKNKIVNIYGNKNVFDLGEALCKYFYMLDKFLGGIYIVFPRNIEEEKESLIKNIRIRKNNVQNGNNEVLILLKLLDINDKDSIKEINDIIKDLEFSNFVICSKDILNGIKNIIYYNLNNLHEKK